MCGIVGYIGSRDAALVLIPGLKRLEYRGYDSAGLAVVNGKGLVIQKAQGKIARLEEHLTKTPITGTLGIAHTRWATHGVPSVFQPLQARDENQGGVPRTYVADDSTHDSITSVHFSRLLKKAHLRRWRARAALRRTH